jgi:molybdenum transport protein
MIRALSDEALHALLREDAPCGDITTLSLGLGEQHGRLVMAARQPMTVCGSEEAARLFELVGASATVLSASGRHVLADAELISAQGKAASLLMAWQVAQMLLAHASGVASEVARIVTELKAAGHGVPLACTREAFPGTRALAVKAVHCAGGVMHSMGLSDGLQLSPAHRVFVDAHMDDLLGRIQRGQPGRSLVVEVASLHEALAMAESGAQTLQLQHFTPDAVRQCKLALHQSRLHPLLAVAGDVHAGNAVAYADAGADILVSSAPYHAAVRDVEVRFARADMPGAGQ